PRRPWLLAVQVEERAEKRVVVQPPGLRIGERGERRRALRPDCGLRGLELREGCGERLALRLTDARVGDSGSGARRLERAACRGRQGADAAGAGELRDQVQIDVERVEGERAERAVRAGLERRP